MPEWNPEQSPLRFVLTHKFRPDKVHRTYLVGPAALVDAPWCYWCGRVEEDESHQQKAKQNA